MQNEKLFTFIKKSLQASTKWNYQTLLDISILDILGYMQQALSGCLPHFRHFTCIENVVWYHPHWFHVTRPKTAVLEAFKFIYLASLLTYYLCPINILKTYFKGALSGLKQFLAIESPLKMIKNNFYFTLKAPLVVKIFKFFS